MEAQALELGQPLERHLVRLAELQAAAAGASSAWRVVDEADGLVQVVLTIKASPPTYNGIAGTLGDLLADAWRQAGDRTLPVALQQIDRARADLEAGRLDADGFKGAARQAVVDLEDNLEAMGRELPPDVRTGYARACAASYTLGRAEVGQPLGWSIDFNLQDQDAVHGLANSGLWWVGDAWGSALDTDKLKAIVERVHLQGGEGRVAAGEALAAAFAGEFTRPDVYWRGLAATVATRARSFGALSAFEQHGGTRYEYVNPDDERTSEVCRRLNGTSFTVKGALDLRQRLLEAPDPKAWKAISPWPRPRDLEHPDGTMLDPAALQAKGIAWPPLHFHCRSTIDVTAWLPADAMPDHDQAPTPTPAPAAPKPRKPRAPAKPKAPKAPPVRTWANVKGELAASEANLAKRGLAADSYGKVGHDARAAIFRYRTDLDPTTTSPGWNSSAKPWPDFLIANLAPPKGWARGSHHLRMFRDSMVLERKLAALNSVLAPARLAALDEAIAALEADLQAIGAHQRLVREAAALAPADWRAKQRAKLVAAFMGDRPSSFKAAQWKAVLQSADEALDVVPDDLLHLLVANGERFKQTATGRASASAINAYTGGKVNQDAHGLISWGRLPDGTSGWVPDRDSRGQVTLAHEVGHRIDGMFGAVDVVSHDTGRVWVNHADAYPEITDTWRKAWGEPFEATIQRDAHGNPLLVKLAYEPSGHSVHRYAGTWVEEYEARIYNGRASAPLLADLKAGLHGGPVEFTSMGTEYVADAQRDLRKLAIERATPWNPKAYGKRPPFAGALTRDLMSDDLAKARELYGVGHRDAVAKLYRGGERQVRKLIEQGTVTAGSFNDDADVITTAMSLHYFMGADLEDLLFGPKALLRPFLSNGSQGQAAIRTMVTTLLPSPTGSRFAAQHALEHAHDVISKVVTGSAVTDPPTAAALALPL